MAQTGSQEDAREGIERRRHSRFSCDLKMTFTILASSDATPFEYGVARAKDLSESGVCIYVKQEIQTPVLMQLNINLPMRPFHLLVLGKAVRCIPAQEEGMHEIGLKFVGILPPEFKHLVAGVGPETEASGDQA